MKKIITFPILMLFLIACGHNNHQHHGAHVHEDNSAHQSHCDENHVHEENLQLTAYNDSFEVFAEISPLAIGHTSNILAHFTHLKNFKPLEKGKVTASLIIDNKEIRHCAESPSHPGIYRLALTPEIKGVGKIIFEIETEKGVSQLIVHDISVYGDEHTAQHAAAKTMISNSNGVFFSKEMSWKVDFATERCRLERFGKVIRTIAQIEPSQEGEQIITAKSSGIITFTNSNMTEGKTVSKDQALFIIASGDLIDNNLSVRFSEAENNYTLAKREFERKSELFKDQIVSESDFLQAKRDFETSKTIYENLLRNISSGSQTVSARMSGYISSLLVRNGEYVETGYPLAIVRQNNTLYVKAEVQAKNYSALKNAISANFRELNGEKCYSLKDLDGRLLSYGKSVSTERPLLPVIYQIKNVADFLPGTFLELYIKTKGEKEDITIPNSSLVEEMGNYFVYVQLTPEYFEKREVKIGDTDGKRTAILSGLNTNERVISKGANLVKLAQSTGTLDAHAGHVH